ncbi:hypothetical protein [Streptomyces chryseus]|uniref:hypothetical protein n=1 Tax=Streptomyces chryseus TaxID=68186 RepID=UPI00142EABF1|nr:hypothetical protein [Streptomyces chryseus]GGX26846.1 hypothetical protein GCM10010353_47480 [Streptomyces chryseus]
MKRSFTIHTADGHQISVTPVGDEYDLHVCDEAGESTATVRMGAVALAALRAGMGAVK